MIAGLVMFGGLTVMLGGMLVMFGSAIVVLGALMMCHGQLLRGPVVMGRLRPPFAFCAEIARAI